MEMEVGKCYQFTRLTGKVIRCKVLVYTNHKSRIEMREFNHQGFLALDFLTDAEFATVKQIECEDGKG